MILSIVIWYVVGFFVVRYTDNGALAMIAYNSPFLAYVMLVGSWTLWPLMLVLYFLERGK